MWMEARDWETDQADSQILEESLVSPTFTIEPALPAALLTGPHSPCMGMEAAMPFFALRTGVHPMPYW